MDELTLGLIGAGAVVVGGVVVYNAWQGAKVRRRMPRPMPEEAAEAMNRPEREEELPFIEPVRQPVRRRLAAPAPAAATGGTPAEVARVEPTFGGVAPADTPADLQAEATGIDAPAESVEPVAGEAAAPASAHDTHAEPAEPAEPVLPAATTISSAPPAIVDRRIDCIVPIRLGGSLPGDKILPAAQLAPRGQQARAYRRQAGRRPVGVAAERRALRGAARGRAAREPQRCAERLEFSEFVTGVQQFADAIDGAPEFPDMMETVAMARELDAFAAQCDAQLSINVMSDGAPWSANYVQAVASQDGLLLSRDGTRFVKLDAKQNPVFMLQFGDTNFLRDDLTYKGGNMITLVLDVPVAEEDILPFRLMCDYAKSLSERIGARVVDDSRRPLPESTLVAIDQQLMKLYAKLEEAGIPAGSPVTRRLFSQ